MKLIKPNPKRLIFKRLSLRLSFIIVILFVATGLLSCSLAFNVPFKMHETPPFELPLIALYPSSKTPDQVVLTMAQDPATMQTINWRTAGAVEDGVVQYRQVGVNKFAEKKAAYTELVEENLLNDAINNRFWVTIDKLEPDTVYEYRVGSKVVDEWSPYYTFVTAPQKAQNFAFAVLGDFQKGYGSIKDMLKDMEQEHPETAFYVHTGDTVETGAARNMMDQLLDTIGIMAQKPLAPALGNHEFYSYRGYDYDLPLLHSYYFHMPQNGTPNLPDGHSYSFTYSNVYFIVLNSYTNVQEQTPWLESELKKAAKYDWKIVVFHHPMFNIKPNRQGRDAEYQAYWMPLIDKYEVDLVLNGHEHSYMRTQKVYNGKAVQNDEFGTVYVVTNAGEKHNDIKSRPMAAVQKRKVQTYQIIELSVDENAKTLHYYSYDTANHLIDEFALKK